MDKYKNNNSGNSDNIEVTVKLINTPPKIINNKSINITVTGDNVTAYKYNLDSTGWSSERGISHTISVDSLSEGEHTLEVIGKSLTNTWQGMGVATSYQWKIDTEKPVAQLAGAPSSRTNNTGINITVGGEGAVSYMYNLNVTGWSDETGLGISIMKTGFLNGTHTLEVIAKDSAGNWQETGSATTIQWTIDTDPPTGTFIINNGNTNTFLYWVGLYSNVPDAVEMRFRNDGDVWSDWEAYDPLKKWEAADGVNSKHVYARYRDEAGNVLELDDTIGYYNRFLASDNMTGDWFGKQVAIKPSGDAVIITSQNRYNDFSVRTGAAYLYSWDGTETIFTSSDGESNDRFAMNAAISDDGNTLLMNAPADDDNGAESGSFYIFKWDGVNWNERKITATDGSSEDYFGFSVSISDDGSRAVVGAPGDDDLGESAGTAYLLNWNGSTWEQERFNPSGNSYGDFLGTGVAVSGDGSGFVLGAPGDDDNGNDSGSLYVLDKSGDSWSSIILMPVDGSSNDYFGKSVFISGDGNSAFVGSPGDDSMGSVYKYRWSGGSWIDF